MNFCGSTSGVFPQRRGLFDGFLEGGGLENPKADFPISSAVSKLITLGVDEARMLNSGSRWYGVTYREDASIVVEALGRMVEAGLYSISLRKNNL